MESASKTIGTRKLGGSSIPVGEIGYGLMGLTAAHRQTPDDQAFACMKTAIERGSTFFDGSEFYGFPEPTLNLQLLNRFFTKYPEYADKVFLSVKGAYDSKAFQPNCTPEGVRQSVDNILKYLDGKKKLDLFQCARVDPNVPIETTIAALAELVKEGKFSYIGMSECSAETIRRAHKIHPITAVEIEYSLFSTEPEGKAVIDTCKELGIAVIAYSPLGRGFLAGTINKLEDLAKEDRRRMMDRFQPENFDHNIQLVKVVKDLAKQKGCTPAQLAIAWVETQGDHVIPIPGSTAVERLEENLGAANVKLSEKELAELKKILDNFEVKGARYSKHFKQNLWG